MTKATAHTRPEISKSDAAKLDATINNKIQEAADKLARTYVEVGKCLKQMRDTHGFVHLGFERWENYLDSKSEYGRTYLSYLYKLGQAGELQSYLEMGMSGSKLIEFAKRTDFPEKIPDLIAATWEEVKNKSARDTAIILNKFVEEHAEDYRRQKTARGGRPKTSLKQKLAREYERLSADERGKYLSELREFLKETKATTAS